MPGAILERVKGLRYDPRDDHMPQPLCDGAVINRAGRSAASVAAEGPCTSLYPGLVWTSSGTTIKAAFIPGCQSSGR